MEKHAKNGKRIARKPFVKPLLRGARDWGFKGKTAGWGGHHHHSSSFGGGFASAGPGWGGSDGGS